MPVDDLLGKPFDFVDQFNARAEGVLHGIKLYCLDKLVYALGYSLEGQVCANVFEPAQSIDALCALLQLKKNEWIRSMQLVGVDIGTVTLAHIEAEDEVVAHPEPFMMEWN